MARRSKPKSQLIKETTIQTTDKVTNASEAENDAVGKIDDFMKKVGKAIKGDEQKVEQMNSNKQHLRDDQVFAKVKQKEEKLAEKAEAITKLIVEQEETGKAQEAARIKLASEKEAVAKAETEARIKAEKEAAVKAETEARIKAEKEAAVKAETEARIKAEKEAAVKAETEARIK
ncbi:MAG: hypothetical protein ACOH15_11135, partial [Acetobacterium sp.]